MSRQSVKANEPVLLAVPIFAQNYHLHLGPADSMDGSYSGLEFFIPVVTLDDSDTAGLVVSAPPAATVSEDGSATTITLSLRSEPTATVTVPIVAFGPASEVLISPSQLVFAPALWNQAQVRLCCVVCCLYFLLVFFFFFFFFFFAGFHFAFTSRF